MSETQEKASATADPFEPFRTMRDSYLDAMAKSMVEAVNSEAYAQATGTMLESYMAAAAPFREAMDKSMKHALQQLSLPSREEVAALAERFANLEMRLDDMDAKLGSILKLLRKDKAAGEANSRATKPRAASEAH
ncbi:MAG TPA: poly(R)-hydroxyalkanoic acid synthase subunit PhaE [Acidobacteriaceae bacterium]|nr:poly(R)-hydroxyalkanoic acid synthase subunit PhaE [Acidobacteriaceae bacterium]